MPNYAPYTPAEPQPVEVDGVKYVPINSQADMTFDLEIYMADHCAAAGLADIPSVVQGCDGPEAACAAIVSRAAASGRVCPILAGAYVREGQPWTREGAATCAAAFAGSRDPEVRRQLWGAVAAVVLGFIVSAAESQGISLSSLMGVRAAHDDSLGTAAPPTSATSPQ